MITILIIDVHQRAQNTLQGRRVFDVVFRDQFFEIRRYAVGKLLVGAAIGQDIRGLANELVFKSRQLILRSDFGFLGGDQGRSNKRDQGTESGK